MIRKLVAVFLGLGLAHASGASECRIPGVPKVLVDEPHKRLQFWLVNEDPVFWSYTPPPSPSLPAFRRAVQEKFKVDVDHEWIFHRADRGQRL